MGVFSEIAMEQQNSMFDSSAAFEDDEAFELEEMESLPVPPVGTDTVPVSAASVCAGETALADAEEEPADEVAPAGEEKSAEEGNSAQPPAAEDEEKKRAEHEAAEAQRKAEFDAKQQAKKAAEQEQIARLEAMSDEEVIAASTQRVSTDVEKLTRRNMKECVSEHIQMLCMEDTAFARLTMHPKKNMIRCFQYINRKAWDYVQDELKASGTRPGPGQQTYGCDVPDDMCYQWAEDYFRDPDAKEDHEDEEKFVPKLVFSDDFVEQNRETVTEFLLRGGAAMVRALYGELDGQELAVEALRRIVQAELMGQFYKLKYFAGDLQREIRYPVSEMQESLWKKNLSLARGAFLAEEVDDFYHTLRLGELPHGTCLSYRTGSQRECLLAAFDSNKKIILVKKDETVVARACLRLTKGAFQKPPAIDFSFADLSQENTATGKSAAGEKAVLFLESVYTSRLNDIEKEEVMKLAVSLTTQKAAELGVVAVLARKYLG